MSETNNIGRDEVPLDREFTELRDSGRFKIREKTFRTQYRSIYTARLRSLRGTLRERVKLKWGNYKILQLTNLSDGPEDDEPVILIGTLYKHQELKPSILKEMSEELQLIPQPSRSNYSSTRDQLFLEDETLRVKLVGDHMSPSEVVTGLVCAVLGRELEDGCFWVQDFCFPGMCPRVSTSRSLSSKPGRILLLSGLDMANTPDSLELELLTEWITGMAGDPRSQGDAAAVGLVIIAGNSVRGSVETYTHRGYIGARKQKTTAAVETIVATHRFDKFLREILGNCGVLLMPGEFDPSNHSIPQQSLHYCILPESSRFKTLHGGTNPWIGKIGDRIVAGSSGQPVDDIRRVAGLMNFSPLDCLEKTLSWRHFSPTAPDTLPAYPYFDSDPFVIEECPDIYFVGNMEGYSTKLLIGEEGQSVRLISIPKFSSTSTAVIVDLDSLETHPISFRSQ
ncbi:DNA polymerase delta subunit 2 [Diachasma alloeum]|uniref:DNA polymerase delta subunit 2 n=1 Tax=Diachasma alloeum TaxID=454923 RepID=UPI0007383239|nr:DNA polymerase delta subunit 2 [Diachasma alloeum]